MMMHYLDVYSSGPTDDVSSENGRLLFFVVAEWDRRCAEFSCYLPHSNVAYPNGVPDTELLHMDSTTVVVGVVVNDCAFFGSGATKSKHQKLSQNRRIGLLTHRITPSRIRTNFSPSSPLPG